MSNSIGRWGISLPQYHNHYGNKDMGNVRVIPLPRWRRIFRWWPFFVGDRVSFDFEVDTAPDHPYLQWAVFERMGAQIEQGITVKKGKSPVRGKIINGEGDVEYSIGPVVTVGGRLTLFTAKVINYDTIFFQAFWLIVGVILTFVSGIVLGFIDIVKFWKLWMP